jgi:hypothetical protein
MGIWSKLFLNIRHEIVSEFYGRLCVMMYMNVGTRNDICTINCNKRDKQNTVRVDTKMFFWKDALTMYFSPFCRLGFVLYHLSIYNLYVYIFRELESLRRIFSAMTKEVVFIEIKLMIKEQCQILKKNGVHS